MKLTSTGRAAIAEGLDAIFHVDPRDWSNDEGIVWTLASIATSLESIATTLAAVALGEGDDS